MAGSGWRAERDPAPAHLAGDGGDAPGPGLSDAEAAEVADDVTGLLALLAVPVGAAAARLDPYCGAVFADQAPDIVEAMVPLVMRSERAVRWMRAETGGLTDWLGLAKALAPVGVAVFRHHVFKSVELAEDEGQAPEPAPGAYTT